MSYSSEVLSDSPTGYWRLGEAAGATAVASEVNSASAVGSVTGTVNLGYSGALIGDSNTAMDTITDAGWIIIPDNAIFHFGDTFSIEAWYQPADTGGGNYFVGVVGKGAWNWYMQVNTEGQGRQIEVGKQNAGQVAHSSGGLVPGYWYHLVWTKTGSTTHIYINGVEDTVLDTNYTMEDYLAPDMTIGGGSTFASYDEVAFYPTVLSPARVLAHYEAANKPGTGQFDRPTAESVTGSWTYANAASFIASIGDAQWSPDSRIISPSAPSNNGCRVKLATNIGDPNSSAGYSLVWAPKKNTSGGATMNMTMKLYQGGGDSLGGGTLIGSWSRNDVSERNKIFREDLTTGEANSITDHNDLYLEFFANQV